MFNFDDILRGYSSEQYAEAMVCVIANFLKEKGLIDMNEYHEYYAKSFNEVLNMIVERDRKISKEKYEKIKAGD